MEQQNNTLPSTNGIKRLDTERTLRRSSYPITSQKRLKLSISTKEMTELNSLAENIAQLSLNEANYWHGKDGMSIDID